MNLNENVSIWIKSLCSKCELTPCCNNIILTSLKADKIDNLKIMLTLISFKNLYLLLKSDGTWYLYLKEECQFFDKKSKKCIIHETDKQSNICKKYKPHTCWYINSFSKSENDLAIHFNYERFKLFISLLKSDSQGNVIKSPNWEEIIAKISIFPLNNSNTDENETNEKIKLFFPPSMPEKIEHLDLIRYRLGFKSIAFIYHKNYAGFMINAEFINGLSKEEKSFISNLINSGITESIMDNFTSEIRQLYNKSKIITSKNFEEFVYSFILPKKSG